MEYSEPTKSAAFFTVEKEIFETEPRIAEIDKNEEENESEDDSDDKAPRKQTKFSLGMKILAVEFGLFLDICVNFLDAWVQ